MIEKLVNKTNRFNSFHKFGISLIVTVVLDSSSHIKFEWIDIIDILLGYILHFFTFIVLVLHFIIHHPS